jgi:hypothetical protein
MAYLQKRIRKIYLRANEDSGLTISLFNLPMVIDDEIMFHVLRNRKIVLMTLKINLKFP